MSSTSSERNRGKSKAEILRDAKEQSEAYC
jgi:hypothetical protein